MAEDSAVGAPHALGSGGVGGQNATEDVVSKYKRLLSMARSSLEANQAQLSAKDQQISQLLAALEEEKSKKTATKAPKDDDAYQYPRRLVCRVDVEGLVWVLIEFDSSPDEWKSFADEESLAEFIRRMPGIPLVAPQKRLSAEESARMMEDTTRHTERIVEEFRRYKVRTEIALKQKSIESKPSLALPQPSQAKGGLSPSGIGLSAALDKALTTGHTNTDGGSELSRMRLQLAETETKWRVAYEKLAKELEVLKTRGAESVVAAQWRTRYEASVKDKEELTQKLDLLMQLSNEVTSSGMSLEQLFLDIEDDYKSLRKRLTEMVREYRMKHANQHHDSNSLEHGFQLSSLPSHHNLGMSSFVDELSRVLEFYHIDQSDLNDSKLVLSRQHYRHRATSGEKSPSSEVHVAGKGMAESKVQYLRQMVFQLLVCNEPEVKAHIEAALIALLRFNDEERAVIDSRKREETQTPLTSIATFWESFTSSSTA